MVSQPGSTTIKGSIKRPMRRRGNLKALIRHLIHAVSRFRYDRHISSKRICIFSTVRHIMRYKLESRSDYELQKMSALSTDEILGLMITLCTLALNLILIVAGIIDCKAFTATVVADIERRKRVLNCSCCRLSDAKSSLQ